MWRWQGRFAAQGFEGLLRDKTRPRAFRRSDTRARAQAATVAQLASIPRPSDQCVRPRLPPKRSLEPTRESHVNLCPQSLVVFDNLGCQLIAHWPFSLAYLKESRVRSVREVAAQLLKILDRLL